jgi:para-aminobenzoate synthetase component I
MTCHHHILEPFEHTAPFWRLVEAFRGTSWTRPFLLDSALAGNQGRFSYLGPGAAHTFAARRRPDGLADVRIEAPGYGDRHQGVDPFALLRDWRRAWHVPDAVLRDRPAPFMHGAVGWIAYEAGHCVETYPDTGVDDLDLPDIWFGVQDVVFIRDHGAKRTWLSVVGNGMDAIRARERAHTLRVATLEHIAAWTPGPDPAEGLAPPAGDPLPVPYVTAADYRDKVRAVKDGILDGRVFECCLTHRFDQSLIGDPWDLYAVLRRDNAAPFACWLEHDGTTVVGSSPERFLRLDTDGVLETRPIKGTRPRADDPAEDAALRDELAASAKDRAENVMIVDLARNDLGRVCETGSVHVPGLCEVEGYATVWQLVSTVRGKLRGNLDGIDAVRACFPGGSMTGAPKIEAMKMIDELEHHARGVYSGAIGWLESNGTLDLNIVIRTVVARDGRATYGTGGAVTADSDPEAEWRESLDKVRALARAIAMVNPG